MSEEGTPKPILAGGRLSGRAGPYSLGLLLIREETESPFSANDYIAARVTRDILKNSNVGFIFLNKETIGTDHYNRSFGADANFRFLTNLQVDTFWAKTSSPGRTGNDRASQIAVRWLDNFWDASQTFLGIGDDFNAETGFVPRIGIRKSTTQFGVHPRPGWARRYYFREFFPHAQLEYVTDHDNRLLTRVLHAGFGAVLVDEGQIEIAHTRNFERLDEPFRIRPEFAIGPGDYSFNDWTFLARSDPTRILSAGARFDKGGFFSGRKKSYTIDATVRKRPNLAVVVSYSRNKVVLPDGSFNADLLGARLRYAYGPTVFFDVFTQYNIERKTVSSNIRFNIIHRPLSDLFVVYNEERSSLGALLLNRSFTIKFTYLLDF